jgi:hypothetical protein
MPRVMAGDAPEDLMYVPTRSVGGNHLNDKSERDYKSGLSVIFAIADENVRYSVAMGLFRPPKTDPIVDGKISEV